MEKVNGQTELAEFVKEIRERFKTAGKPRDGFFRRLLKQLLG
jgi:hypothetical protein